jgi:hypothetical protein
MTRGLFLLILALACMVVLPISVKAMEPVEYGYYLGGKGKLISLSAVDSNYVQEEEVGTCLYFYIFPNTGLLIGQMVISTQFLGDLTMYFTGSFLGKDNPNLRLTFLPVFPANTMASAIGSFDNKNIEMKFVIQSPNLGSTSGYGAFTGNFELTKAGAASCP